MLLFISFAYAFLCRCVGGKQCVCVIGLKKTFAPLIGIELPPDLFTSLGYGVCEDGVQHNGLDLSQNKTILQFHNKGMTTMSCPLGRFVTLLAVSKWVKYFRINYGINQMRFKVT